MIQIFIKLLSQTYLPVFDICEIETSLDTYQSHILFPSCGRGVGLINHDSCNKDSLRLKQYSTVFLRDVITRDMPEQGYLKFKPDTCHQKNATNLGTVIVYHICVIE